MDTEAPHQLTQAEEDEFLAGIKTRREEARKRQLALAEQQRIAKLTVPPAPQVMTNRVPTKCLMCGEDFEGFEAVIEGMEGVAFKKTACEPCVAKRQAELDALNNPKSLRERNLEARWAALCEPEFRTLAESGGSTDPERLARDCQQLPAIAGWPFGPKGLMIRGDTGRCKTRAVWRLVRAQFDAGRTVIVLTSGKFARECQDAAGKHATADWFDRLAAVDVFVLDDLGKAKWTEFVWSQFFELLDDRAKNHRPVIVTTNETRKTLEAKCADPVTWHPLIRRIDENTQSLSL